MSKETPAVVLPQIPVVFARGPRGPLVKCEDPAVPDGAVMWLPVRSTADRFVRAVCPCGCRQVWALRVVAPGDPDPEPSCGPHWEWDGNEEAPSLVPSVNLDRGCGWHGYLKGGVWIG